MFDNRQPVKVEDLKDENLISLCSSLEKLGMKIYMIYGEDSNSPAIHMEATGIRGKAFEKLVRYIGLNNFASHGCQITLRPHNYGDWESYLSLEPVKTYSKKGLAAFALLMEACAGEC